MGRMKVGIMLRAQPSAIYDKRSDQASEVVLEEPDSMMVLPTASMTHTRSA